jgi:hypothetical protein
VEGEECSRLLNFWTGWAYGRPLVDKVCRDLSARYGNADLAVSTGHESLLQEGWPFVKATSVITMLETLGCP